MDMNKESNMKSEKSSRISISFAYRCIAAALVIMAAALVMIMYKSAGSVEHSGTYLGVAIAIFLIVLVLAALTMIMTASLVITPLSRSRELISRSEELPVHGAEEYAAMAHEYNKFREANLRNSEALTYEATHDELTGLCNRKLFDMKRDSLEIEDGALMLIDIDDFKTVNDTFGHDAGDKVLKKVANALSHSFRHEDYTCRIGGDEFAVIMAHMNKDLKHIVENKINQVINKIDVEDGLPKITVSVGAAFAEDADKDEDIFLKADKALYRTKDNGKNGYSFY